MSDTDYVLAKLRWMRARNIWPNGLRHLWTDAFGLVLFTSRPCTWLIVVIQLSHNHRQPAQGRLSGMHFDVSRGLCLFTRPQTRATVR